ncbi:MAG: cupin domain-containing protein [Candidatus Promineofilum sp.]|nr:cupin domain-containing protein [Promineifilum sp.]
MSDTKLTYVPAGEDQFGENRSLGVSTIHFKVTSSDGRGPLVLENEFHTRGGPARHLHHDQDEWFYIVAGEFLMEVGDARFTLRAGDSLLAPRRVPHVWACVGDGHGRILVTFYPAGRMEAFFRAVTPAETMPPPNPALWEAHGMTLLGPPLPME